MSFNGAAGLHQRKRQVSIFCCHQAERFNGAAGLHQRKRIDHAARRFSPRASMGPLVYTSGNRPYSALTSTAHAGFNGAAGLHQRKLPCAGRWCRGPARASMGPLVYTSGNSESARPALAANLGFNGAAGLHQRKPNPPDESRVAPGRLQWGRWFTPAETCASAQ